MAKTKEHTVADKLQELATLQEVHSKLDAIQVMKGELPMEVADLEDELAGLSTRLSKIKAEVEDKNIEISDRKNKIKKSKALLENYLIKSNTQFRAVSASPDTPGVKIARLRYEVVCTQGDLCLLKIQIFTGKFHQIRFQLSCLGHPIWNDEWYGAKRMIPSIKIGLYSYFLGFDEPKTEIRKEFRCLPELSEPWNLFDADWKDRLAMLDD